MYFLSQNFEVCRLLSEMVEIGINKSDLCYGICPEVYTIHYNLQAKNHWRFNHLDERYQTEKD